MIKHVCPACNWPTVRGTQTVCGRGKPCRVCPKCGKVFVLKPGTCGGC